VELRCESTWQGVSERCYLSEQYLFSKRCYLSERRLVSEEPVSDAHFFAERHDLPEECLGRCRRGSASVRAYSSIGQSPRLITGLFLVRTQVGPRALSFRSRAHSRRIGARVAMRRSGARVAERRRGAGIAMRRRGASGRHGVWGNPVRGARAHGALTGTAMRRPTYL
jgi:hypothetical protein